MNPSSLKSTPLQRGSIQENEGTPVRILSFSNLMLSVLQSAAVMRAGIQPKPVVSGGVFSEMFATNVFSKHVSNKN